MNEDLEEYISKRCEKALLENDDYIKLQKQLNMAIKNKDVPTICEINVSLQILVEQICYIACAKDMNNIFANIKN